MRHAMSMTEVSNLQSCKSARAPNSHADADSSDADGRAAAESFMLLCVALLLDLFEDAWVNCNQSPSR